jgi:hypoxanthine phosphoribosyltransferase
LVAEAWPSDDLRVLLSRPTTERTHHNISQATRRQSAISSHRRVDCPVRFAHPAEAVVAGLLDSFGVRWQYEPTTFPLVTSETGQLVQCFTPDFYLPEHGVYIEMTTMRQALVTRKNRKFRLMRELYPDVNVRLLYRKDVELIMERYDVRNDSVVGSVGPVTATAEQMCRKAEEAATFLAGSGREPIALIALNSSAERFRDHVAAGLAAHGTSVACSRMTITRARKPGAASSATVRLSGTVDLPACRRVLLADVIGTGLTVRAALDWLAEAGIPAQDVISLFDRRSARIIDVPLAVPGLPAASSWLVGAGLGGGAWARMPDVHTMMPVDLTLKTTG